MKIAIDLGGTNVRAALVKPDGEIEQIVAEPCQSRGTQDEVVEQICRLIDGIMTDEVDGIGIGVPSVVDVERGIVYNVVGIPSWKVVPLKDLLEARFGLPVAVDNDCNCFALAVSRYGRGRGFAEAVGVTLGTGVGGSLVVDGKLYHGRNAGAGEIGSVPYLDKDYEYYCSSRFFLGKGTTGREAFEEAMSGNPAMRELWKEFGGHVGRLVHLIMYAYDPSVIVFGGSIAKAFSLFKDAMWQTVKEFPYPQSVENLEIFPTALEYPGILGAAALCE